MNILLIEIVLSGHTYFEYLHVLPRIGRNRCLDSQASVVQTTEVRHGRRMPALFKAAQKLFLEGGR